MDINQVIANELKLNRTSVDAAVSMLDDGATVPFIARYRKEATGGLTDENLRDLEEKLVAYRNLEDRKKTVFKSLDDQNIQDEELRAKITEAMTMAEVEDLYRPYKPKKVTRASKAIKAGLKPLSEYLKTDKTGKLKEEAKNYICEDYPSEDKCIQGALDIIAEEISDNPNYRTFIKNYAAKKGQLTSAKISDADTSTYDNYADYSKRICDLKSYNILAINRGVDKKALTKKFVFDDEYILNHIKTFEIPSKTPYQSLFEEMIADSYNRLIFSSVSNDIFSELMDKASDQAIEEFKVSLKATLLYPPLKNKKVLGFDPGFTHGCKLAFIDEYGKVLDTHVLADPFHSGYNHKKALDDLKRLIIKNQTYMVALGNGTASRESQKLLEELKENNQELKDLQIAVVSESGASIWSATKDAQKEFPDFEPNLRSAVSIARRLQDPLAELVKIPPESIGVGQYQYDIEPKKLSLALKGVVEDCVNAIGVNLNTASGALLSYISGISSKIADNIVKYREENGAFKSRNQLLKVSGLGPKAYENAAGFLRIPDGKEPLDNTAVHPESYPIAKEILKEVKGSDDAETKENLKKLTDQDIKAMAERLEVGVPTLSDIIHELIQPSRDPRENAKTAHLTEGVTDIKDIQKGAIMEGTIRNVTGFGFFVDIGVEINGLVYISEITNKFIQDPHPYGKPGDIVKVKVLDVDLNRKRISLSMKNVKQD
ncbi:RNA-binding transcriptional accessory protein [Treponema rectale]|uniref:RNA-binding transcriptional accessory protein n=1 Tax=Treponema rectale TaxID=744512 RepID=A0A7M1XJJ7_9SPIR|nr:RNA-binding transcriptional accessory protein [Treponema rectale]